VLACLVPFGSRPLGSARVIHPSERAAAIRHQVTDSRAVLQQRSPCFVPSLLMLVAGAGVAAVQEACDPMMQCLSQDPAQRPSILQVMECLGRAASRNGRSLS